MLYDANLLRIDASPLKEHRQRAICNSDGASVVCGHCPKGLPMSARDCVCMHFINNSTVSTNAGQLMRCRAMDFLEPCVGSLSRAEAHADFIQGHSSVELR